MKYEEKEIMNFIESCELATIVLLILSIIFLLFNKFFLFLLFICVDFLIALLQAFIVAKLVKDE